MFAAHSVVSVVCCQHLNKLTSCYFILYGMHVAHFLYSLDRSHGMHLNIMTADEGLNPYDRS
jgi:hypothetical protein